MRYGRTTAGLLAVAALALAACGDDGDDNGETVTDEEEAELPATGTEDEDGGLYDDPEDGEEGDDAAAAESGDGAAAGDADVQVGSTDLGEVLVDADGNTLYGFTDDVDGVPTCEGECADAWPALLVEGDPAVSDDLDADVFSVVEAIDGGSQVVAGDWPLYTFSGDSEPGGVNGQGVGGVWFVVAPDGSLIEDEG